MLAYMTAHIVAIASKLFGIASESEFTGVRLHDP